MLFASRNITVTASHGTAELALGFGGEPANALDLARLREFDAAIAAVADSRFVNVLVIRSAIPAGFCAGLRPEALASLVHPSDRAAFAWYGQHVLDRLAHLDAATVAFIEGPCLGAGLELALACDHRVCVARPTTHLGFPDRRACFGGTARMRGLAARRGDEFIASGRTLSGREAASLGIVDAACCERRATIELRSFLDQLEARPVKSRAPADVEGLAAERRTFAARVDLTPQPPSLRRKGEILPVGEGLGSGLQNPIPPFPTAIGLLGNDPNAERLAAEVVLRGGSVVVCGNRSGVFAGITRAHNRGFITPLEAEQAWRRVRASDTLEGFDRVGLALVAEGQNPFRLAASVRPRTVIGVIRQSGAERLSAGPGLTVPFPFPGRLVRLSLSEENRVALFPGSATTPDTLATLAAWLKPFGHTSTVFPVAARLLPRAA